MDRRKMEMTELIIDTQKFFGSSMLTIYCNNSKVNQKIEQLDY